MSFAELVRRRLRVHSRYRGPMRIVVILIATLHALFVAFTTLGSGFAEAGDAWERLSLAAVHPLGAVALIALATSRPKKSRIVILVAAVPAIVILVDTALAPFIAMA